MAQSRADDCFDDHPGNSTEVSPSMRTMASVRSEMTWDFCHR